MGQITSELEFINYLKLMMGNPVVNVEVADEQFSQCIYDSIQLFQRYHYGEGNVRDVLTISLSAGTSAYQLPEDIDSVLDIKLSQGLNNINTLFTPQHNLLYADFINGNMYNSSNGGSAGLGGAMVVGNYYIQMMYLTEIEEIFTRKYVCDLNSNNKIMTVKPTPNVDTTGIIMVYRTESAINLYNHPLVKRLALAKARQLHAWHLQKYNISIPSGATLNASELMSRAVEEEKQVLADIVAESEPPIFICG